MRFSRREFLRAALGAGMAWSAHGLMLPAFGAPELLPGIRGKHVLILGAGLAGLVAGYELSRAGHDVAILEASSRSGGRVWTLREPFSERLYAEAGAGRIPAHHNLTLRYVHAFGLTLEPFYPASGATVTLLKGKRYVVPAGKELPLADVPFALTDEERRGGWEALQRKYVDPYLAEMGDPGAADWLTEKRKQLDQMTWIEAVRQKGASEGAAKVLLALTGWDWDSALDFFRDDLGHRGAKSLWKIRGGNDMLPKAFATRLAGQIRYEAEVTRIEQDAKGVRAICGGSSGRVTHQGEYLICAIPFSVLRRIEIVPQLPADKQEVVEKIYYDPVVRTYAQVGRRFWEGEGLNGFGEADESGEIWQPTFSQPGPGGIVHTYLEDAPARRATAMHQEERTRSGLATLGRVFPGLADQVEDAFSFAWADQPWARGAYVAFRPGEITRWKQVLPRPEGRIHFAGEHTSPWPGWMQGALHSGLRAAREVHQAP